MMNRQTSDQILYFRNTLRHYAGWIVLGTIFLSVMGAAFLLLLPDHYKASTTILVDPQKVPEKYVSPTVSSDPAQRLSTITQEVLSSTRLQQIIDEYNLYPELRAKMSRDEIIEIMRTYITITVKQGPSSGLSAFTIEYEGSNPQLVAKVANELANSFITWNVRDREQQSQDTTNFLNSQLTIAKQNLEEQEKELSAFKLRHLGEMPEQEPANLQALSQLQNQFQANADALDRIETEKTMLTHGVDNSLSAESAKRPVATERDQLEEQQRKLQLELLDLKRRYTDEFPAVVDTATRLRRISEQLKTLPPDPPVAIPANDSAGKLRLQALDQENGRLTDEQAQIAAEISGYRSKVDAVPIREQEMADLSRNYAVSKDHYQSLLDKAFQAQMASDLEQKQEAEHFTVLDVASVPEKPFKPQRRLLFPVVALISFMVSVGLTYLKDLIAGSPRIERELRNMLPATVPVLTSIPKLPSQTDRRRAARFAVAAFMLLLIGCGLNAALLVKFHPKL